MSSRPPGASEQDARDATVRSAALAEDGLAVSRKSLVLAAVGLLVTVVGIYIGVAATRNLYPFSAPANAAEPAACTQTTEHVSDAESRLRPPSDVSVQWGQSQTEPGHVTAAIYWTNNDSRTTWGLIEVAGRYGAPNPDDEPARTDGRELPANGLCGLWLRQWRASDDGERGVFFDGLWPSERYCFAVNVSDPGGGVTAPFPSVGTEVCDTSPWRSAWGTPAVP